MKSTARLLFSIWLVASIAVRVSGDLRAATLVKVAGGSRVELGIPAVEAKLREPFGTAFDSIGNIWIIEMAAGNRLLKVDSAGTLIHVAGTGEAGDSGDGGSVHSAQFNGPHNLDVLPNGDLLIADTWNGRIRRVDPRHRTVSSLPGFAVPASEGKRAGPYCITLDFEGRRVYVADLLRITAVDVVKGTNAVIAGNGRKGVPRDGDRAVASPLIDPRAAAPDRAGRVYVLERGGNALRVVDVAGNIRTVVNRSGEAGTSRGTTVAHETKLRGPKHLCVDRDESVLIADAENHRIVRYRPADERVEVVAGTGTMGAGLVGGDPLACALARPHGVAVHPRTGEIYITDSYNDRILKIVP